MGFILLQESAWKLIYLISFRGSLKVEQKVAMKLSQVKAVISAGAVMGLMQMPFHEISGRFCRGMDIRGPAAIPAAFEQTMPAACQISLRQMTHIP